MALDETGLLVKLEANVAKWEKDFNRAITQQQRASKRMEQLAQQNASKIQEAYSKMGNGVGAVFKKMAGPLAALVAVKGIMDLTQKLSKLSESYTKIQNTLKSVGQNSDAAAEKIAAAAIRSRAGVEDMAQSVARIQKASGAGFDDTIRRVETLQKLLTVGGASGAEVNSVTTQLSQALSSGVLQGDELKSLREAAPVELLDAIAKAAGGTRAQLKDLGADGKLTSAVVLQALDSMASGADEAFGKTTITTGQAFENLTTGVTTFIGRLDDGIGASDAFARGISDLGSFLAENAGVAEEFGRSVHAALSVADELAGEAKQALIDLGTGIKDKLAGSVQFLTDKWDESGLTVGEVIEKIVSFIGELHKAMGGAAAAITEAFLKIPDAVSGGMQASINAVIDGVETMINAVLDGVRSVAGAIDALTAKMPGVDGTNLASGVGTVEFGRVEGLATNFSNRSINEAYEAGSKAVEGAVDASVEAISGLAGDVQARYQKKRQELADEAARRDAEISPTPESTGNDDGGSDNGGKSGGKKGRSGGPKEKQDDFQREVQGIRERIAAMQIEAQVMADVAASGESYGDAMAYATAKAQLLAAAQQAGTAITPELERQIDSLAQSYAEAGKQAEEAANKLGAIDDNAKRGAGALSDLFMSATEGGESFANSLRNIAKQLLDGMIQKMLLSFAQSGAPGSGFIGAFGGMLGGFSEGGYTGAGSKYQPAGVVHAGEYVFSAETVKRLGVGNLERLHQSARKGYAEGGLVSAAGKVASAANGRSGESVRASAAPRITIHGGPITVNGGGGSPEQNADLAKQIARESEASMRALVQGEMVRQMRPGGLLKH